MPDETTPAPPKNPDPYPKMIIACIVIAALFLAMVLAAMVVDFIHDTKSGQPKPPPGLLEKRTGLPAKVIPVAERRMRKRIRACSSPERHIPHKAACTWDTEIPAFGTFQELRGLCTAAIMRTRHLGLKNVRLSLPRSG